MKILPFLNKYFLTPHIWINSVPSLLPLFPISEAPSIGSLIHVVRNFRVFFSIFFPFSIFPVCLFVLRWSVVSNSATSWTVARQVRLSVLFSRQDYWSGLLFPISGIFTTQIWDPCLLSLLNCRWILHPLSHPGSPFDVFFPLFFLLHIKSIFKSFVYRSFCSNTSDPNGHCIQDLARCTHLCHDNPYHFISFLLSSYNLKFFSVSNISKDSLTFNFHVPYILLSKHLFK